jgi:hypothetical protein
MQGANDRAKKSYVYHCLLPMTIFCVDALVASVKKN